MSPLGLGRIYILLSPKPVLLIHRCSLSLQLYIHLTYYATAFSIDLNSFLICADNPVNTFSLTSRVAKRSDGTEIGDTALPVVNVCLNGRITLNKTTICLNSLTHFHRGRTESVGALKRSKLLLWFQWPIAPNCQLLDNFLLITQTTSRVPFAFCHVQNHKGSK